MTNVSLNRVTEVAGNIFALLRRVKLEAESLNAINVHLDIDTDIGIVQRAHNNVALFTSRDNAAKNINFSVMVVVMALTTSFILP